jgi:hypothetical protein
MKPSVSQVLLVAILAAGCARDEPTDPRAGVRVGGPRAELDAAVRGRRSRGFEDDMLRLEAQIPGLGGVFRDHGKSIIYLRDLSRRESAVATIRGTAASLSPKHPFRAAF